jgi:hypothetical protein
MRIGLALKWQNSSREPKAVPHHADWKPIRYCSWFFTGTETHGHHFMGRPLYASDPKQPHCQPGRPLIRPEAAPGQVCARYECHADRPTADPAHASRPPKLLVPNPVSQRNKYWPDVASRVDIESQSPPEPGMSAGSFAAVSFDSRPGLHLQPVLTTLMVSFYHR